MKKLIAVLLFALMFLAVGSSYADVFDENTQRYHCLGTNDDGNTMFVDKNSIRHEQGNLTNYIGILRFSNHSNLFNKARDLVKPTEVPLYAVSQITLDCDGARVKTGKMAIAGVDRNDPNLKIKILWSLGADSSTEWSNIPNGIEPNAKALLCGPSF